MAMDTRPTAHAASGAKAAGMAAVINRAESATEVFRAAEGASPRRINTPVNHPPMRFPASAVRNGIQAVMPISLRSNPYCVPRYFGNQKI